MSVPAPIGGNQETFLTEHLLVSSRLHEIVSDLFEIKRTFCLLLNSKCRRLLGFFSLSALSLIALTVSKEISLLASSDRMSPPSGLKAGLNFLPLCLIALTCLFCFSICYFRPLFMSVTSVYLPLCFLYRQTIEKCPLLWYNE
mgnify:CR=1 FL=1|jgi:hypothetical protein